MGLTFGDGGYMTIEIINDNSVWDSFVDESPDRVIFHTWKFLKIVERYSGYTLLPFGIFEKKKNKLICLFPLFYRKRMGMKFLFSQPPMSGIPFIGMLMNAEYYQLTQHQKENYLNTVVTDINSEIETLAPHYVSISLGRFVQDIRPFQWNGFDIGVEYTFDIDLNPPLDIIWNLFSAECRREIRSAERYNPTVKETNNPHDVEQFYAIMENRYQEQLLKFPLFGPDYLKEVLAAFPGVVKLYTLYNSQVVINMSLNFEYNNRHIWWMGGVNLDRSIHSNEFLMWEFIKQAKVKGYDTFELGGADVQRLSRFKSKFNPRLKRHFYVYKKTMVGKFAEWTYINLLKKKG